MGTLRSHLTYANVVSSLCLFIVLGGAAYAATSLPKNSVGAGQIKRSAVRSSEVKDHSLLRKDFKAGQLPKGAKGATGATGPAGAAGSNAQLQGTPAGGALAGTYPNPRLSCPAGTAPQSGFCFETTPRAAAVWTDAATACAAADRRLATPSELWAIAARADVLMTAHELTTGVYSYVNGATGSSEVKTVFEFAPGGVQTGIRLTSDADDTPVAYRCVVTAGSS